MVDQKKTGVWLDSKKAVIVSFIEGEKTVETVESGIEGLEREEGEGSDKGRFGGQGVDPERKKEHHKEQEISKYLEEVIGKLADSDAIVIFGPAEIKTKLTKKFDNHPDLRHRLRAVKTVDSMTNKQIVALVKTHYNL